MSGLRQGRKRIEEKDMTTLIIGGSGSGKSAFAEQLLCSRAGNGRKYYLATMQVYDEEGRQKVERHRSLRQGKGFRTVECPAGIGQVLPLLAGGGEGTAEAGKTAGKAAGEAAGEAAGSGEGSGDACVLLECMSNLTANEMFGPRQKTAEETAETILAGIEAVRAGVRHLVIVSNNVFEDGEAYDPGTQEYLKALALVNRRLAGAAEEVIEVVAGLPAVIKHPHKTSGLNLV